MLEGLKVTTPSDTEILITRQLNAGRRLVWDAMTRPDLIRRWLFLPPGYSMAACEEDVRPGGTYRWAWNGPDGKLTMSMSGAYREVVPYERSVRTERFDIAGAPAGSEQIVTLTLSEQGGVTNMSIRVTHSSKANRDAALASGMEQGMSAGYANLDALLAAGF